jgi:hypothetical protein
MYFPVIIALAWVMAAYVDTSVDLEHAMRPLVVVPALVAATQIAVTLLTRSRFRGAVATGSATVMLLVGVPGLLVLAAAIALELWRRARHRRLGALRQQWIIARVPSLSPFSVVLVGVLIVTGMSRGAIGLPNDASTERVGAAAEASPSIYVILLDGHARADVLGQRFELDPGALISGLTTRGFEVAEYSHSNYVGTVMTMVSMLYMAHS